MANEIKVTTAEKMFLNNVLYGAGKEVVNYIHLFDKQDAQAFVDLIIKLQKQLGN